MIGHRRSIEAAKHAYRQIKEMVAEKEGHLQLTENKRESLRAIRSIARSVLPNATETKIVVTANARALRHFLRIRGSIAGDSEMRTIATELLRIVSRESPSLFHDFQIEQHIDGFPIVVHSAMNNPAGTP